jgi:hypothetical protein
MKIRGKEMSLIIYSSAEDEPTERLKRSLELSNLTGGLEVHQRIGGLMQGLHQPPEKGSPIVIIMARENRELLDIESIAHLFHGYRLVLVVPDEEEILKTAHRLRPRFLTYLDGDFSELPTVLRKMEGGQEGQ